MAQWRIVPAQIVPAQGILWSNWLLKPHTLFGDSKTGGTNAIESDVLLAGGDVEIGGRYADRNNWASAGSLTRDGRWN